LLCSRPSAPRRLALLAALSVGCNLSTPHRFFPDAGSSSGCPTVYAATSSAVVDDECLFGQGRARFQQTGCDLSIDYRGCPMLPGHGVVDSEGGVAFDATSIGICSGKRGAGGTQPAFSITCQQTTKRCHVDMYAPPFPTFATTRTIRVNEVATYNLFVTDRLRTFLPFTGYLSGGVVLGDRIAVVTSATTTWSPTCGPSPRQSIAFFDRHSLREINRVPAPSCLTRVWGDRLGRGFYGLYGGLTGAVIGYFDPSGSLVRSASVALDDPFPRSAVALALIGSDDGKKLYAGYSAFEHDIFGYFAEIDAEHLDQAQIGTIRCGLRSLAEVANGLIAGGAFDSSSVVFIDRASARERGAISVMQRPILQASATGYVAFHKPSMRLAVGVGGITPNVQVLDGTDVVGAAQYYEHVAGAWAMHEWPLDRSLLLVGLTTEDAAAIALIALYNPTEGRFLPGTIQVGVGAVLDILEDDDHHLWLILPWSSSLVEVTPIPP
jgi:hypothetical protein